MVKCFHKDCVVWYLMLILDKTERSSTAPSQAYFLDGIRAISFYIFMMIMKMILQLIAWTSMIQQVVEMVGVNALVEWLPQYPMIVYYKSGITGSPNLLAWKKCEVSKRNLGLHHLVRFWVGDSSYLVYYIYINIRSSMWIKKTSLLVEKDSETGWKHIYFRYKLYLSRYKQYSPSLMIYMIPFVLSSSCCWVEYPNIVRISPLCAPSNGAAWERSTLLSLNRVGAPARWSLPATGWSTSTNASGWRSLSVAAMNEAILVRAHANSDWCHSSNPQLTTLPMLLIALTGTPWGMSRVSHSLVVFLLNRSFKIRSNSTLFDDEKIKFREWWRGRDTGMERVWSTLMMLSRASRWLENSHLLYFSFDLHFPRICYPSLALDAQEPSREQHI